MDTGKDSHRHVVRIIADKHFVDFENCAELAIECFFGNVGHVQEDLVLATNAETIDAYLKDLARRDVAGNKVAVTRILLFEEVPTLGLWN